MFKKSQIIRLAHRNARRWFDEEMQAHHNSTLYNTHWKIIGHRVAKPVYRDLFAEALRNAWAFHKKQVEPIAEVAPHPHADQIASLEAELDALKYLPLHISREARARPLESQIAQLKQAA